MFLLCLLAPPALSQTPAAGTLKGKVTLANSGEPLHGATITVSRLGRIGESEDDGTYEIKNLAPGQYSLVAHLQSLSDETKTVTIKAGETAEVNFELTMAVIKQSLTVTANGREQSTLESFQSVTSLDALDLSLGSRPSLGEVLDNQPGVAKRSFGPGTSRPVIRGFDGDRVLIMQDGIPTGTLSSQSGDHGESLDTSSLDRVEIVKGPATLLYGSNAIGGVVNAITGHHQMHGHSHPGVRGYVTGFGGSTNGHAGGAGGFDYGAGKWLLWGSGSAQRTGDYNTPAGKIENSQTRVSNASGGFGRYGDRYFFDLGYRHDEGRYGVPFASSFEGDGDGEPISLAFRRHNVRASTGWQNANSFFESFRLSVNYSDWQHKELEGDEIGTVFNNKQTTYRGVFQQRAQGRLTGSFGFQGTHRDYETTGAETLAPPVKQNVFAVFGLQEYAFERIRFQFGGRVENTRYNPTGLRERSFTGASGAAGIYVPLWNGGAFVSNYTHSFRAPALEELYNNGPHVGNLTYEVGNPNLRRERSDGVDFAVRHQSKRIKAEVNVFDYRIRDFVYLAPSGKIEDGLPEADYDQADSRFTGTEAGFSAGLNQYLWLNLGADYVNARLRETGEPLPRIPPLRGRAGIDIRFKGLSIKPELRLANQQDRTFGAETRTAGYAVFGLSSSYTIARQHLAHVFGFEAFNLTDRLYRNHLSFIKDRAPEIGARGTVRLYGPVLLAETGA
jgi:iron complex outermembrane recepter protein